MQREQSVVRLLPGRWTAVPGSNVMVWWQGAVPVVVRRRGEFWDLSTLVVPGRVHAWVRLTNQPGLGPWPLTTLPRRVTYRSRTAGRHAATLAGGAQP